jgi:N-formylglutamate amidohydrolase
MYRLIKTHAPEERFRGEDLFDSPVEILTPARPRAPFVFASPHSGRRYPASFIAESRLDPTMLRASEDAYVDELMNSAPRLGAPLVAARFPRALLDANRDPWELDPAMFDGPLPVWAKTRTPRVTAGLGAIPRVVADGAEIYKRRLPVSEAHRRIDKLHRPYHAAVERLLMEARSRWGVGVLIDCHSMPSVGGPADKDRGRGRVDVVLGDRFGSSCAPELVSAVESRLAGMGLAVARNSPYAGGWSTERYGRPERGLHALQIEINRHLYLDEREVAPSAGFQRLRSQLESLIRGLIETDMRVVFPRTATLGSASVGSA